MRASEAPHTIRLFESLSDFADFAEGGSYRSKSGDAWAGATFAEALALTREGDLSLVSRSEALLEKFESTELLTKRREWISDIAGVVPSVPAYIAGHPQAMRRRAKREHEAAPVTVYVDLFLSAAFSVEDTAIRGAAVLAFVRVLARFRPVTLLIGYGTLDRRGRPLCPMVRLNTTPLDLAHAAYAFGSASIVRRTLLAVLDRMVPGSSPWPPFRGDYEALLREVFGSGEQLVVVKGGMIAGIVKNPAAWIEARLREAAPEVLGEGPGEARGEARQERS